MTKEERREKVIECMKNMFIEGVVITMTDEEIDEMVDELLSDIPYKTL